MTVDKGVHRHLSGLLGSLVYVRQKLGSLDPYQVFSQSLYTVEGACNSDARTIPFSYLVCGGQRGGHASYVSTAMSTAKYAV